MLPVTITPNSINILLDGRMRTVQRGHINFNAVNKELRILNAAVFTDEDEARRDKVIDNLRDLLDIPSFIAKITEGRVQVGDGEVRFDGQTVKGVIADRLLALLREGHDVRPLAKFLDRVSKNPDLTARDEIYLWMESGSMPLTDDGCFLAFKKVNSDYSSSHRNPDGSIFWNHIGTTVTMDRSAVDKNRHNTCSQGLHFCSFQYLSQFGLGGESKVIILKIAPEDVVSIPTDYNHSKGRAWRYAIIGEVPEDECQHLFDDKPVVSSWGTYDNTDDGDVDPYDEGCDDCECRDGEICEADDCAGEIEVDYDRGRVDADPEVGCCGMHSGDDHEEEEEEADDDDDQPMKLFKKGRRVFTADAIKDGVNLHGQRGFAKKYKVPRTTLQGWIKQIG